MKEGKREREKIGIHVFIFLKNLDKVEAWKKKTSLSYRRDKVSRQEVLNRAKLSTPRRPSAKKAIIGRFFKRISTNAPLGPHRKILLKNQVKLLEAE